MATLLLASGAVTALVALYRFSPSDPSLKGFIRAWEGKANTLEGQRVLGWLSAALSLQLLGAAAIILWLSLRS